jgi:hypothetical protein
MSTHTVPRVIDLVVRAELRKPIVGKNDVLQRGKEVVRRQLDFFEQRY